MITFLKGWKDSIFTQKYRNHTISLAKASWWSRSRAKQFNPVRTSVLISANGLQGTGDPSINSAILREDVQSWTSRCRWLWLSLLVSEQDLMIDDLTNLILTLFEAWTLSVLWSRPSSLLFMAKFWVALILVFCVWIILILPYTRWLLVSLALAWN